MIIVWTCHTFEDNFGMKHTFEKYLKESCRYGSDKQLSIKHFPNVAFVGEIPPK